MSGALVDLVAQGVQDAYLTGKPEVSFFRQNYKRHTNFSYTTSPINAIGQNAKGGEVSFKIPAKGDLLSHTWLDLGTATGLNILNLGADTASPTVFELHIGGQMVDRQDANFMSLKWQKYLLDTGAKGMAAITSTANDNNPRTALLASNYLPLHFFFCDEGPKLPLVALQYNEVEIKVKWSASSTPANYTLYSDFILLDTTERAYFVDNDHELLIEQVQRIPVTNGTEASGNFEFDLSLLNHPVKCLIWDEPTTKSFDTGDVMIYLNGTQLFEHALTDKYFAFVQAYYHSEFGSELMKGGPGDNSGYSQKMYSFALKASKHQPTGTCNFSRLDNAKMTIRGAGDAYVPPLGDVSLHAVNFNVLRIKKGQAGVAFSN